MERRRGNQLQTVKILGIGRGTIRKKLQRYFGLERSIFVLQMNNQYCSK
jgi:DNA-binding NtrC family response regulator